MSKKLARIYVTYGKGDGEELDDQFIFEDSTEGRKVLIADFGRYDYAYDSETDFIEGKSDSFQVDMSGGDWDDPTGKFIAIYDKEELLADLENKYKREVDNIERLFKEGE